MIGYGVQIAISVSDNCYDIEVKGQGQIYLQYVYGFLHILGLRVFILSTVIAYSVRILQMML